MRRRGLLLLLSATFLTGGTAYAAQPPRVLIVQQLDPIKDDFNPNLYVSDFLASELEGGGLLVPIVWGMSDPIFRAAAMSGALEHVAEVPTLNEALAGASKLGAQYTIWLRVTKEKGNAKGLIRLYNGRKEAWKDDKTIGVQVSGAGSFGDSAKSLAHTWALMLATKPLKDLKIVPKADTPVYSPGQQPPTIAPPPTEPIKKVEPPPTNPDVTKPVVPQTPQPVDNGQLKKDLAAMVASGRRSEAILRLRDAVDQEPLDLERRTLLIETIMFEDPALAAAEARRAAVLFPDRTELRILAARAWMRAGSNDEARGDLNEAVARDPNGQATRLLLAEIALEEGKPEQALEHVEATLKPGPYADGLFYRALCRSLLGGAEGLAQDLEDARKVEPNPLPDAIQRRYDLSVAVFRRAMKSSVDDERSLLQRAMVRPKDEEVRSELDRLERVAKARAAFMDAMTVPVAQRRAFEQRRLAASLIGQSLLDLQQFLSSGDEDSLTEARINLGEASKHLAEADS